MNKPEIYEVLAKRQDCNANTLQNPSEDDHLSQYFKEAVEEAEDMDDLQSKLKYAADMLNYSLAELKQYESNKRLEAKGLK